MRVNRKRRTKRSNHGDGHAFRGGETADGGRGVLRSSPVRAEASPRRRGEEAEGGVEGRRGRGIIHAARRRPCARVAPV